MSIPVSDQVRQRVEDFQRRHKTALVTMLFTDMVGSTQLKQELGDSAGVALTLKHHEIVRSILKGFPDAQEISVAGDSFFIVFVKPSDAVRFSLLLQSHLRTETKDTPAPIRVRIGIHLGEVSVQIGSDGTPTDYLGIQVDIASRVMSLAQGDQILCTRTIFDSARQVLRSQELKGLAEAAWLNHGEYRLKGVEDPVEVCEVGEKGQAVLSPPPDSEKALRHVKQDEEEMCGWRPAPEQMVPNTEWVLKERLGEGGFGETWKAENRQTKEIRVFKFCFKASRVRSLRREITLFRLLKEKTGERQPFVRLYDVQLSSPPYYLEMDYVDGPNLEQWVKAEKATGRAIGLQTKLEIVAQIAEALGIAHEASVVHNDVKPTNVLISRRSDGKPISVKLSDFGIGQILAKEKLAEMGVTSSGFTQSMGPTELTATSGTRLYLAPELLMGRAASAQSDFYSLGVILYQLHLENMNAALPADWEANVKAPLMRADMRWLLTGDPARRPADGNRIALRLRTYAKRRLRRAIWQWSVAVVAFLVTITALQYAWEALQLQRYYTNISLVQNRVNELAFDQADESLEKCPAEFRNWEWGRLRLLCHLDMMTLKGHSAPVFSVVFSPDGKWIASGSEDKTIKIWDAETGRELATLAGHQGLVGALAFSPDGKRLASGSSDQTIKVWDAQARRELMTLKGHSDKVWSVAFSPDGKAIASGSKDKTVRIWDASTGKQVAAPKTHDGFVFCVCISPDGGRLASSVSDGSVRISAFKDQKDLMSFKAHSGPALSVAFSADGQRIATGGEDKTVKLWDLQSGKEMMALRGHSGAVWSVSFSQNGKSIASGSEDKTIKIWNPNTGDEYATLRGHTGEVYSVALGPTSMVQLATASQDMTVKVWRPEQGREVLKLKGHTDAVQFVTFSPLPAGRQAGDGKRIASGSDDKTVRMWNVETGEGLATLKGHSDSVLSGAFSPEGKRIATGSADKTVRVWDVENARELMVLKGHSDKIWSVAFSPNGKWIASAGSDKSIKVWDAVTGENLRTLKGHSLPINSVSFSPDSKRIVSGAGGPDENSGELMMWNAGTGQELMSRRLSSDWAWGVTFGPDGKRVASCSANNAVKIWSAGTGRELMTLKGHAEAPWSVAFSPDGKRLASGGTDKKVKIWDTETGRELMTLRGHFGAIASVAFSPDGRRVASGDDDSTILVWKAAGWEGTVNSNQ